MSSLGLDSERIDAAAVSFLSYVSIPALLSSAVGCAFFTEYWMHGMPVLAKAGVTLEAVLQLRPILVLFMCSAASGKYAAACAGPDATARFLRFNALATLQLVVYCALNADWLGCGVWTTFMAIYLFFGFSAGSSNRRKGA